MPFDPIQEAIRRHAPRPHELPPAAREAAVALVLRAREGGLPELLMIRRAEVPGDPWSGHMAFPGGRRETRDASIEDTALRETREELALDLGLSWRLGALQPVVTPTVNPRVAPMHVHASAFGLLDAPALSPNREVASVHWFGLDRLLADEGRATFPYPWQGQTLSLPCVRLDGCFIWGMSLRMIDDLLARLRAAGLDATLRRG